jgi:hypothetical protein
MIVLVILERRYIMTNHFAVTFGRAVFYSFLSGVAAGIIYVIIALVTGGKWDSSLVLVSLITGGISFVIALVFFSAFMLYFARNRA